MPELYPLPDLIVLPIVDTALREDLGRAGDLTTDAIVPTDAHVHAAVIARAGGRIAGLDAVRLAFRALDPMVGITYVRQDGGDVQPGETLALVDGATRALLSAERVALNLLGRMSGIATITAAYVRAVGSHSARILDTRKTTPGLRVLEKYAVRAGGGMNHRFGLDDGVLIKDNHIACAGGIEPAVERVRASIGHMVRVQVEVDTLAQLEDALALGVDAVLLDNMGPDTLREAVRIVNGRAITEASGNVTLQTVEAIAASGVNQISVGALTHSAPALDVALDILS